MGISYKTINKGPPFMSFRWWVIATCKCDNQKKDKPKRANIFVFKFCYLLDMALHYPIPFLGDG